MTNSQLHDFQYDLEKARVRAWGRSVRGTRARRARRDIAELEILQRTTTCALAATAAEESAHKLASSLDEMRTHTSDEDIVRLAQRFYAEAWEALCNAQQQIIVDAEALGGRRRAFRRALRALALRCVDSVLATEEALKQVRKEVAP